MKSLVGILVIALVGLSGWTVYANVLSDDPTLRVAAEVLARDKAGCGATCKLSRLEESRGAVKRTIAYSFAGAGDVTVTCRRPYIAFGAFACEASAAR